MPFMLTDYCLLLERLGTGNIFVLAAYCNALSMQAIDRRERLRRLALETIDLSKDPYFMRNHLGQYECRLCLTLHNNEGNYLAHTQVRGPCVACLRCACLQLR